jgi:hypothetical protein
MKRRSPWIFLLALASLAGALFAVWVAYVWRWVDCNNESWDTCSPAGAYQLYAAIAGLVPVAVMLIESFRRRGHPLVWLGVAAAVYVVWGVLANEMIHG